MSDPSAAFFEQLAGRADRRVLGRRRGAVRVELEQDGLDDRWVIRLEPGAVSVSAGDAPADAVLRTSRAVFDDLVEGRLNLLPAILRGAVWIDGDVALLTRFQRLLPGATPISSGETDRSVSRERG